MVAPIPTDQLKKENDAPRKNWAERFEAAGKGPSAKSDGLLETLRSYEHGDTVN